METQLPQSMTELKSFCNRLASPAFFLTSLAVLPSFVPTIQAADSLAELKSREAKVQAVAKESERAVVSITGAKGGASGSGVIVSKSGLILTAAHVLDGTGDDIRVTFADGTEVRAEALGRNRGVDAGLVQIVGKGNWKHVEMAKADAEEGQWCVALGYPNGFDIDRTPPLRIGRIAAPDGSKFLSSDCTLTGGDSGGPLFNLEGEVVGIHSSISGSLSVNRHVPVSEFRGSWDRMMLGQSWGQMGMEAFGPGGPLGNLRSPNIKAGPKLGIAVQGTSGPGALTVTDVVSPAAKSAGLRRGDLIEKIDDKPIRTFSELVSKVHRHKVGDTLKLTVFRDETTFDLDVKLVSGSTLLR